MSDDIFSWPKERKGELIDPNLVVEEERSRIPREENPPVVYSPPIRPPHVFFEGIKPLDEHEHRTISAVDLPKLEEVDNRPKPIPCEELGFVELNVEYQILPRRRESINTIFDMIVKHIQENQY